MRSSVLLGTLGILGLTLLPGCPLLAVEAEIPEVCMTYTGIEIAGVGGATSLNTEFTLDDLGGLEELTNKLDATVHFVRAEVRARGVSDLAFVDRATLTIASGSPDSTLPELVAYDCDGTCLPDGLRLAIPATLERDALAYVESASLLVGVEFAGQMPEDDWSFDVDVCMKGTLSYALDPRDL
ncbi:MAG: hypothetical protein KIT31_15135 [Deltaproteobacteria bacterium]|nr:hypothetical protein [Deltaproteobacteria bacterium]